MPFMCTVFAITVIETVLTMATPAPITLRLQSGRQECNFVHVNFYGDTFYTFYSCLRNNQSLSCSADVTRETKHQTDAYKRRVLSVDAPTISRTARVYSNIFTCSLQSLQQKLVCSGLPEDVTDSSNLQQAQLFHHLNDSSSKTTCVGIQFQAVNESLIFDPSDGILEKCNTSCNISSRLSEQSTKLTASLRAYSSTDLTTKYHQGESTSTNVSTLHHHGESTSTDVSTQHDYGESTSADLSTQHDYGESTSTDITTQYDYEESTSTDITTQHLHGEAKNNNDYRHRDKSHIIIAVVVSFVVTVGLVIAGVLFRRHLLSLIRQPNAPYAIGESRPHLDVDSTGIQGDVSGTDFESQKDAGVYDMSIV